MSIYQHVNVQKCQSKREYIHIALLVLKFKTNLHGLQELCTFLICRVHDGKTELYLPL